MAATERIRDLDRFKVIQAVADGGLKSWRAAERLGLSVRQVERLAIRSYVQRDRRHQPPSAPIGELKTTADRARQLHGNR